MLTRRQFEKILSFFIPAMAVFRTNPALAQWWAMRTRGITFSPASISDLEFWVRSDLGCSVTGGKVTQWNDQSGHGRHLTPGAAATQPAYTTSAVNGNAAITFDGTDDYLSNAFGVIAQPFHVFWVGKQLSNTANEGIHGSATWGERSETIQAGVHNIVHYAGSVNANSNGGWVVGQYELVASLFSGVTSSIIVNNDATVASGGNPGNNGHDGLILGALSGPVNFGNVAIAEFVIYSSVVSGADLVTLRAYFNTRYALW